MTKKPHPFEQITTGQAYHDRMAARSDIAFEEGKVSYLLGVFKFNVRKSSMALRAANATMTGRDDLTFQAFNAEYGSFPILLGTSRLGGISLHLEATAMLPALFKAFGAAPFMTAFDEFYEKNAARASGRTVGMVFPRKGLKNGLIVYAADDPHVLPFGEREAYFTYVGGSKKDRHWILVRSFQKTLEAIHNGGHGWRPDA